MTLALYDGSGDLMYWNILGAGEIVGRAVKEASSTDRQYYVKDHLGSIRGTINESGGVDHQSDYYPFGLEMPGRVTTTDAPRERYTGHEIEGLGSNTTWYYAGARMYDPIVARCMTTDPLAEKFPWWSRYNCVGGNPIMYFHCMANCEAAQRGTVGKETAKIVSAVREVVDYFVNGDSIEEVVLDLVANDKGRRGAADGECTNVCVDYKPDVLAEDKAMKSIRNTLLRNVTMLMLIAFPLLFLAAWVQGLVARAPGSNDMARAFETGAFYYLGNFIPVLIGGLAHNAMIAALPVRWPELGKRLVAFCLSIIVPVTALVAWGGPATSLAPLSIPLLIALAVYAMLLRFPNERSTDSSVSRGETS
jgi:RHS repeat-associated protein